MSTKILPTPTKQKTQATAQKPSSTTVKAAEDGKLIKAPRSNTLSLEKRAFQQVQEELVKTKEQLALCDKSRCNLVQDLARSKRTVEELTAKLRGANESSKQETLRAEEIETASSSATEDLQRELVGLKKQYELAVLEVEASRAAIEALKDELAACMEAKDEAVKLAGDAMSAAELSSRRVEELNAELEVAKELVDATDCASKNRIYELMDDLTAVRQSLVEVTESREKIAQEGAAKEAQLREATAEVESLRKELDATKELKMHLADATLKIKELQEQLKELSKANEFEVTRWAEREAKALAEIASLKSALLQKQQELTSLGEKESIMIEEAASMRLELEQTQGLLQEIELSSKAKVADLNKEVDTVKAELFELKLKEDVTVENIGNIDSLKMELKMKQDEVLELKEILSKSEAMVSCLTKELSLANSASHHEISLLKEREAIANTQIEALQSELAFAVHELEEAQSGVKLFEKKVNSLQLSLEKVNTEKEEAMSKAAAVIAELKQIKENTASTWTEVEQVRQEHKKTLLELENVQCYLEAEKLDAQRAREGAQIVKEQAEAARKAMEAAALETRSASQEAKHAREEAECTRNNLLALETQSNAAKQELQATMAELDKLKLQLHKSEVKSLEAEQDCAERKLSVEIEVDNIPLRAIDVLEANNLQEEEILHANESGQCCMNGLEEQLKKAEEQLMAAIAQVHALQLSNEELAEELEAVRLERDAHKKAVQETQSHLADTEKAKSIMEAEIQRLLDDSKLWKMNKDLRDISVHPVCNAVDSLDCREEKPLPDSPDRASDCSFSLVHKSDQEMIERDIVQEESLPNKKKKKALFHKLHSYLDKKKGKALNQGLPISED